MKSFKQIISEVKQPKTADEKKFKDLHQVQKHNHPVAADDQFVSKKQKDKTKKASLHSPEDVNAYDKVQKSTNENVDVDDFDADNFDLEDFDLDDIESLFDELYDDEDEDEDGDYEDEDKDEELDEVAKSPYTGAKVTGPADLEKEKSHYKSMRAKQRSKEMGEETDPVDPKALKGKHKDRKDKDIDNDGDVDSSDQYLHKRRQAIRKSMEEEIDSEYVINENKMIGAAKELEMYAKTSGGIDKADFMKAAAMMKKQDMNGLVKFVKRLDTDPKDKIIDIAKKALGKSATEKMFKVTISEEMSYADAVKKIKKIKKGSEVSFTHHTGKKVTGQYRGLKRMGPYSYAHVETGKEAHRVPVHQIHQVQEDVTIADVGKSLSRAYNTFMNPIRRLRHQAGVAGKYGKKPFPPKNPNPSYHTPKPRPGELNRYQFGLSKDPSNFTKSEEVELDEKKKISKNYAAMLKSQGKFDSSKYQVEEDLFEQFKSGKMKLRDGSTVDIAADEVKMINDFLKKTSSSNQKSMMKTMTKTKTDFNEMIKFMKATKK